MSMLQKIKSAFVYIPVLTWIVFMLSSLVVVNSYGETNNQNHDMEILMGMIGLNEEEKTALRAELATDSSGKQKAADLISLTYHNLKSSVELNEYTKFRTVSQALEDSTRGAIKIVLRTQIDNETLNKGVVAQTVSKIMAWIQKMVLYLKDLTNNDRYIEVFIKGKIIKTAASSTPQIPGVKAFQVTSGTVKGHNIKAEEIKNFTEAYLKDRTAELQASISKIIDKTYRTPTDVVDDLGIVVITKKFAKDFRYVPSFQNDNEENVNAYLDLIYKLDDRFTSKDQDGVLVFASTGTDEVVKKALVNNTKLLDKILVDKKGASELLDKLKNDKKLQKILLDASKNSPKVARVLGNLRRFTVRFMPAVGLIVIVYDLTDPDNFKPYSQKKYDELKKRKDKGDKLSLEEEQELSELSLLVDQDKEQAELVLLEKLERSNSLTDKQKERLKFLRCKYKGIGCDEKKQTENRLFESVDAFKDAIARGKNVFYVGKHSDITPRPTGVQSHHGVNSFWMKEKYSDYNPDNAPSVYMLNDPNHNATRGIFNIWKSELAKKQNVKITDVDYSKVSEQEILQLSERQFDAANTPENVRKAYYLKWNLYKQSLKLK
jgi:hypothetical protein